MSKRRTFKDFERYLKESYKNSIAERDKTRRTGVFLAENIDSYYMSIGKILYIQSIAEFFNIPLKSYDPFETNEDDEKFNYSGGLGAIGRIDKNEDIKHD